jgi:hypothetical protein
MRYIFIIIILTVLVSCKENIDINEFKTGTFKTFLEDSNITSIAVRNDTIQIETYNNKKDTFAIEWKSNFEYILTKLHPKNELDSTPFHVKITKFKGNSYDFKAYYKGSNFKQKGKAVKLK